MAYIPDEAIDRMSELTPGALRLFLFLCRCRNGKTGRCFPSVRLSAEAADCHPKNVFKLRKELSEKKFAEFNGDDANLLFAFKSSENTTIAVEPIQDSGVVAKTLLNGSENATLAEKTAEESRKRYSTVAKTLLNGSENATAYKEEPAKEPAKEPERARAKDSALPESPEAVPSLANPGPETTAVDLFRQTFPGATVSIHTQTVIEAAGITDLLTWQTTLTAWRTNGYSERNLSGLFDKYRADAVKAKKSKDWWSRGKSKGFTGAVVSSVITAGQPGKPAVAGGDARGGDGRVVDGAAPDSPGTVAAPVQSRPPNTRPETLREANKRRQSEIRLVEVASEPEMGCPF